jgi:hypothetical protein
MNKEGGEVYSPNPNPLISWFGRIRECDFLMNVDE